MKNSDRIKQNISKEPVKVLNYAYGMYVARRTYKKNIFKSFEDYLMKQFNAFMY
jgi:hypothetical protein